MAMEIKQSLRLSQQLVMTPQLQQAIKLLQLNRLELADVITQELTENPILEEVVDTIDGESSDAPEGKEHDGEDNIELSQDPEAEQRRDEEAFTAPTPTEEQLTPANAEENIDWESYVEDFNSSSSSLPSTREVNEDLPSFENVLTKTSSLEEHLMWQLSMTTLADNEERLGELIIGNLNEDGYLNANLADLAAEAGIELEDAEEVLKLIHNFDPIGAGSRDLRECLLIQSKFLTPRQPLLEDIIDKHLPDLEKRNYQNICKALNITMDKVAECTRFLTEFEPKPGRNFSTGDTQYITPDIYVYKVGDEYVIMLNEDGLPKLRISPYYRNILAGAKAADKAETLLNNTNAANAAAAELRGEPAPELAAPTEAVGSHKNTREYVQDKLRSAVWLIRSIHNRQKTIYKVTEAIVKRQRDFFEKGVQNLKPMILKDVASDIGMHESTISRVTTNKYVHTPVGIFELKYFFNSSINSADGGDSLASEAVKSKIKNLIGKEDNKSPLSDQKIVELLRNDNIEIARRTVAKYREMLGILPSGRRKKMM